MKNILARKSSLVIVLFVAFSIMLMVLINSLFDSTDNGIEKVYSRSFTGDVFIRPVSDVSYCVFGDETPVTGKFTNVETLVPYSEISEFVSSNPEIDSMVPQITGSVMMEYIDPGKVWVKNTQFLFGVDAENYFNVMSSLKILRGKPFSLQERGVMVPEYVAEDYHVDVGDTVQFIGASGSSVRIRSAKVFAVYAYPVQNASLDKIVIVDPYTIRSLLDMSETSSSIAIADNYVSMLEDDIDVDSMFSEDDVFAEEASFDDLEKVNFSEDEMKQVQEETFESNSWNFLIGTVTDAKSVKKVIKDFNRHFKEKGWPVQATNWRGAAGSNAMYLYWLRIIFNAGIMIVLGAGFIVINNTLVVNVLNRTQEIGTMRAEGASRGYVSLQCMAETFMLTMTAGVVGCIFGSILVGVVSGMNIHISNSFLVQLFGAEYLHFSVTAWCIVRAMILAGILGLVGWIYPVRAALSISPVQAMQGAST